MSRSAISRYKRTIRYILVKNFLWPENKATVKIKELDPYLRQCLENRVLPSEVAGIIHRGEII